MPSDLPHQKSASVTTWHGVFLPGDTKPRAAFPFRARAAMFILETGLDNRGAEIRAIEMDASDEPKGGENP